MKLKKTNKSYFKAFSVSFYSSVFTVTLIFGESLQKSAVGRWSFTFHYF
ncbi:hypothetical protein T11_5367 [Trichinella zimbabwensis]|uniref:Uncharacterized protein n=1 Tax=Trichinella zimbabwensis TaxID=268475 RepID=A0A0V1FZI8_9BILA|nr:hypothetical protein T11_5367 [Trichinella zimbabwensis]